MGASGSTLLYVTDILYIDKHSSLPECQSLYYGFDVHVRHHSRRTLCTRSSVDRHYWQYYTQNYYLDFLRGKVKRGTLVLAFYMKWALCFLFARVQHKNCSFLCMCLNAFSHIWQNTVCVVYKQKHRLQKTFPHIHSSNYCRKCTYSIEYCSNGE